MLVLGGEGGLLTIICLGKGKGGKGLLVHPKTQTKQSPPINTNQTKVSYLTKLKFLTDTFQSASTQPFTALRGKVNRSHDGCPDIEAS